jgi:hypothetical protein
MFTESREDKSLTMWDGGEVSGFSLTVWFIGLIVGVRFCTIGAVYGKQLILGRHIPAG